MKAFLNAAILVSGFAMAGAGNATIIDFAAQSGTVGSIGDVTFDQPGTHGGDAGFSVVDNGGAAGNYVYNRYGEDLTGFTFNTSVVLNSLDITRAPLCCGGSANASVNILLYDALNNLLSSLSVGGGTDWQTIIFNQQGVSRVVFDLAGYFDPYDGHAGHHDWFGLDNIVYDANDVPEPSSLALVALGILGFAASRQKKKI